MDIITAIRNALDRVKTWSSQTYATKARVANLESEVENLEVASGVKGEDGFSPIVEMDKVGNTVTLRIIDAEGSNVVEIHDGADGKDGYGITMVDEAPTYTEIQTDHPSYPSFQIPHGKDGTSVSISKVTPLANATEVVFSDGNIMTVYNGTNGTDGTNGKDGTSVTMSATPLSNGTELAFTVGNDREIVTVYNGTDGKDGKNGADGYGITMVDEAPALGYTDIFTDHPSYPSFRIPHGKDYVLTEEDKTDIVEAVIDHFGGQPIVGVVDSEKNITLSGSLPVGAYTLKYDGENGAYSEIVELTITDEDKVSYTNVLPSAQRYASTEPYVGTDGSVGYANDMRISTSSASATYMKAQTGVDTTALIRVKRGDVLSFKNCNLKVTPSNTSYGTMLQGFDSSKAVISAFSAKYDTIQIRLPCVVENGEIVQITLEPLSSWTSSDVDNVEYIMISTDGLDETSIITINQEIV